MLYTINEEEQLPINFIAIHFKGRPKEHITYASHQIVKYGVNSFDQYCAITQTPVEAMISFMENNMKYQTGPDAMALRPMRWPEELMVLKEGNCVDFATFMHFFLQRRGIEHALGFCMFVSREDSKRDPTSPGHCFVIFRSPINHKLWIWNYFATRCCDINGPFSSYEEIADEAGSYFSILYNSDKSTQTNEYTSIRRPRLAYTAVCREHELQVLDKAYSIRDIRTQTELTQMMPSVKALEDEYLNIGEWIIKGGIARRILTIMWPNPNPRNAKAVLDQFAKDMK